MKTQLLLLPILLASAASAALPAEETPIHREGIEWCDIWIPDASGPVEKRVLLVGDSITRGYYGAVAEQLKGKASVARLATSKCLCDPAFLAELTLVLDQCRFDVVHFNNGLHGWGYTEEQYRQAFPQMLATIRKHAPGAKLIWAATTPMRVRGDLKSIAPNTERVKVRNTIAREITDRERIPVNDLFTLGEQHPEYYGDDGVHWKGEGIAAQGAQVAEAVGKVLGGQ